MRRVVTLDRGAAYGAAVTASPVPGEALDDLVLRDQPVRAQASSVAVPDERAGALGAIDGDPGTTWTAARADLRPSLTLSWLGVHRVRGIRLLTDANSAARQPTRVSLTWPGGRRVVTLDAHGRARFRSFRADHVRLRVEESSPGFSLGFDAQRSDLGVGVTELRLRGVPYLPLKLSSDPARLRCGSGPRITVGAGGSGRRCARRRLQLARGLPVEVLPCGGTTAPSARRWWLDAGENEISVRASAAFAPATLLLRANTRRRLQRRPSSGTGPGDPVRRRYVPAPVTRSSRCARTPTPDGLRRQGGRVLRPVVLDGWQQGWQLRGAGPVRVDFAPDRAYRIGLAAGLGALVLLVVLVAAGWRRPTSHQTTPAAAGTRLLPVPLVLGVALVGAGLVAGWGGVALAVAAGLLSRLLVRRWPEEAPWLLAVPALVAALAYVALPWGSASGLGRQPGLAALPRAGAARGRAASRRRRASARGDSGPRPFSRSAGRSTNR